MAVRKLYFPFSIFDPPNKPAGIFDIYPEGYKTKYPAP